MIELVDEDHAGQPERRGRAPEPFVLHLDAFDRAHDEHGEIRDPQCRQRLTLEVGVPRRVDEVDLVVFPLDRRQGERQRDRPFLLLGVEVAHGGAVFDPAHTTDGARFEEQSFGQGGLPVPP